MPSGRGAGQSEVEQAAQVLRHLSSGLAALVVDRFELDNVDPRLLVVSMPAGQRLGTMGGFLAVSSTPRARIWASRGGQR